MMRKTKLFFLIFSLTLVAVLLAACSLSGSNGLVTAEPDEDMENLLTVVADPEDDPPVVQPTDPPPVVEDPTPEQTPKPPKPTAEPTPEPPVVDKTVPSQYSLKEGEFPWCLARRFNVDAEALLAHNGIAITTSYFAPGTVIKIPKSIGKYQGNRMLTPHPTTYKVKAGDTFFSIACIYGDVWPEEIAAFNNFKIAKTLKAGDVLNIP